MKEISDIIRAFEQADQQGKQTALATVVHVDGSSYRRPGARMLVTDNGQLTGAISGGCLEGDALRKTLLAISQQKNMLVVYDTNDEDDARLGMGLGCNGIIHVLIEPVDPCKPGNPIQLLKMIAGKRQEVVLITLFSLLDKKDPQPGTCLLLTGDGAMAGNLPQLEDVLSTDAKEGLHRQASFFKNYFLDKKTVTAFFEVIKPAVSLVIIGAGNDVLPLVKMADILGWETTVVDGRPNYAKPERFVNACQVIVAKPETILNQVVIDGQTVFVLMSHNYNYDLAMLHLLLNRNLVYVGLLGPRKRRERMLDELRERGIGFTNQQLSILHSPVGLDIGAETPEEIALSIITEIKAVLSGKQARSLKNNTEGIHAHGGTKAEEVKITTINQAGYFSA